MTGIAPLAVDYPQTEVTIILIIFFIILIVLFLHLIFRWLNVYSLSHPKPESKEPEITLRKIPSPKFKLMAGSTYLILERTESEVGSGFKTFKDMLRTGAPGLLVTRTIPDKVIKKYDIGKLPVLWLSRSKSADAISPTNLGTIVEEIKEFASQHENSIVMFDGLEYLTVHNKFERVLKFLHSLEDEIAVHKSRLIISLNPKTLTYKKVALLSKEIKVLKNSKAHK